MGSEEYSSWEERKLPVNMRSKEASQWEMMQLPNGK